MKLECFGGPLDGQMIRMPENVSHGWTHTHQEPDGQIHKYEVHVPGGKLQLHYTGRTNKLL